MSHLVLDGNSGFKRSENINTKTFENLIPFRAFNEVPSADSLLSLKLIRDAISPFKENTAILNRINRLTLNETIYQLLAMNLLDSKRDLKIRMGGYTYDNVIKLTSIIKSRAEEEWMRSFIDDKIANNQLSNLAIAGSSIDIGAQLNKLAASKKESEIKSSDKSKEALDLLEEDE